MTTQISKSLTPNDVGTTGSHQAGMAIPKAPDILAFFPALDSAESNPRARLAVHVPALGRTFDLSFIYYNGRLHGTSTRNEYRLTGLTSVFKALDAKPGDVVNLAQDASGGIRLTLERDEATPTAAPAPEIDTDISTPRPSRLTIKGWTVTRKDSDA